MSKKILFVVHETDIGGASVSLVSLIKGLEEIDSKLEIKVVLPMCFCKEKKNKNYLKNNRIWCKEFLYRYNFKYIGEKKRKITYIHDFWNYICVFFLFIFIKKEKFDWVCSNSTGVDVGARAAFLAKVPHIYYVREFMEEDHGCEYRNKKRMKKLLENSSNVIFISKAIQNKYLKLYSINNYLTFFDGIILDDYLLPNHTILKLDKKRVNVILIGTLSDGKGTMCSVEIIKRLKNKGIENVHFEFVGNGKIEYITKVKNYVNSNKLENQVTISGFCTNIKEKLALCDILLMNSRSEGFGRVTVEGMLGGLLVIGRNSAGTKEIIKDGYTGVLFNNDNELVDILSLIAKGNNNTLYEQIAMQGQVWAKKQFDCRNSARTFLNFINNGE